MHAHNGDIQLSAEVSLAADRLVLSYRVENTGGADIYLVNKVYKALPKAEINKDFAYVFLTRARWPRHRKGHPAGAARAVADVAGRCPT